MNYNGNPGNKQTAGLFGCISKAEINDLTLEAPKIKGPDLNIERPTYTGALAGLSLGDGGGNSSISGCKIVAGDGSGSVTGGDATGMDGFSYTGGLIGYSEYTTVINSYTEVSVAGGQAINSSYTGGLIGYSSNSSVTNAFAKGNVAGGQATYGSSTGGLIGGSRNTSVANTFASGNVTGGQARGSNAGGLIGEVYISGNVSDSYATGNVAGGETTGGSGFFSTTGGLIGNALCNDLLGLTVTNCYSAGEVHGGQATSGATSNAGGLIGRCRSANGVLKVEICLVFAPGISSPANIQNRVIGLKDIAGGAITFTNNYAWVATGTWNISTPAHDNENGADWTAPTGISPSVWTNPLFGWDFKTTYDPAFPWLTETITNYLPILNNIPEELQQIGRAHV